MPLVDWTIAIIRNNLYQSFVINHRSIDFQRRCNFFVTPLSVSTSASQQNLSHANCEVIRSCCLSFLFFSWFTSKLNLRDYAKIGLVLSHKETREWRCMLRHNKKPSHDARSNFTCLRTQKQYEGKRKEGKWRTLVGKRSEVHRLPFRITEWCACLKNLRIMITNKRYRHVERSTKALPPRSTWIRWPGKACRAESPTGWRA